MAVEGRGCGWRGVELVFRWDEKRNSGRCAVACVEG